MLTLQKKKITATSKKKQVYKFVECQFFFFIMIMLQTLNDSKKTFYIGFLCYLFNS